MDARKLVVAFLWIISKSVWLIEVIAREYLMAGM
jgi:hypothetical protein